MNTDREIERCLDALETLAETIGGRALDAANAEAAYKLASAQSRLTHRSDLTKRTVGEIDDLAMIECEELYQAHLIANALLTASRDSLRATQARLDGLRTLSAGIRAAGG